MDVICERCKAEYEFDEALLGEKGTTVKCSSCGLVFRVMPANRAAGRAQLRLRYAKTGIVEGLSSLRELQQRIRAGDVSIDDELGREGFPFRPLRDVPELKNFFGSGPHEKATLTPRAAGTGESRNPHAAKTVEGRLPGSPGATIGGLNNDEDPFFSASTNPPPLPNQSARAAAGHGSAAPSRSPPPLREPVPTQRPPGATVRPGAPPSAPPRGLERRLPPLSKQTMLGVGPEGQQVPRAPRMPSFGSPGMPATDEPVRKIAASNVATPRGRSWSDPTSVVPPSPHATLHGAPAPAPGSPQRANAPEPPMHGGAVNDRGGTLRPVYGVPATEHEPGPGDAGGTPLPRERAYGAHAAAHDDESDADAEDASTRALIERLRAEAQTPAVAEPRRLYLDADELAPERVVGDSSRLWFYAFVLLLLGGGGWYYVTRVLYAPPSNDQAALLEPAGAVDAALASAESDAQANELSALAAPAAPEHDVDAAAASRPDSEPREAAPATAATAPTAERATTAPEKFEPSKPAKPAAVVAAASAKTDHGPSSHAAERPVASADPEAYGPWVSKGDQLFARRDFAGAERAFRAALSLRPSGSEANAGLGFALLSKGQTREALAYFDHAANSGYAEANIGLGDAYRKLGQPSSAIEAYQGYLERLPTGPRASYAQGEIDKLKGHAAAGSGDGTRAPSAPPASSSGGYRPAGELVEPVAPSEPAPAQPSEIKP